ncbi:aspergillopepsin-F [Pyricularia oryzae 70-15]|uniref:Aspergillopepsin-F n=1 Tax=Pyricularia oryzae (strain 70-15 / ATCC MYA-4617 / FGSC 8958) TaxID=242507 RepID=G4NI47_PYRO7|nr:aspergillopepsin-F [Pyricularia oryzae 70-15]EHA47907.1 aspergillopepsin-F [Pyricularia oryzae 70-15]
MRSIINLLYLALLATVVSAAPANNQKRSIQKRSFKVDRVRNLNFKGHNGPRELMKAYAKYSMPVPQGLLDAIAAQGKPEFKSQSVGESKISAQDPATNSSKAAGVGLVTATPEAGDVEYLSPVTIGGQTLNLDFDTGSSDLWIFSTMLPQNVQAGHTNFDPAKSTTFKQAQGLSFKIRYGDGSGASGVIGTETVDIGGVTVTGQAVEMATQVSGSFVKDTANNGLVGLAYSKLNTVSPVPQQTFFDNVMPSLAEPLFTADLRKGAVGAYEFGRIDNSKFTGEMKFIPVNTTRGFWQFSSEKFQVGNGQVKQGTKGGQAIADTGTTLILANPTTVQGYYSQVPGAVNDQQVGGITIPCDAKLPDLMLDVGGVMAKVKGSDIVFAQVQGNTCFGGMQPTTSSLQIYGDIFFKSQFVVFNGGNNTLGIADHAV